MNALQPDTSTTNKRIRIYTALLTQTGTTAPTAIVLQNTLGAPIVWTYDSEGQYIGTLEGAFTDADKCWFIINENTLDTTSPALFGIGRNNADTCYIQVNTGATRSNGYLDKTSIEIRVYE